MKKTPNDFWWITKLALVNHSFVRTTFLKISLSTSPQQQVFTCIKCQKQLRRWTMTKRKKTWSCLSSCSCVWSSLIDISINLLVVYRESVNLIGYITRRLSAVNINLGLVYRESMNLIGYNTRRQLWIANENRSPIYFDQSRSFKF